MNFEPTGGEIGDFFQGARFLEKMGCSRDDRHFADAGEVLVGVAVELQHGLVPLADNEQGQIDGQRDAGFRAGLHDGLHVATGHEVRYPMIGDPELTVAKLYDMLPATAEGTFEGRTPADNATVRTVFIIGPDKRIKLMLTYPMTTGRNFDEILRALDSIQLTARHQVATPANWKQGEDVIVTAAVSDADAVARFGAFERILPYLRKTRVPR